MLKIQNIKGKEYNHTAIYKICNLVNGKFYVGSAAKLNKRFYGYHNHKRIHNEHLKRSIEKYGEENFEIKILVKNISKEELLEAEQYYLDKYDVANNKMSYNICPVAQSRLGVKASSGTKLKLSKIRLGKKHSAESKEKISESKKKYWQDNPEASKEMSEIKKKYYRDNPEACKKHGEVMKKYYRDNSEACKEMSEIKKKYYRDNPEAKEKNRKQLDYVREKCRIARMKAVCQFDIKNGKFVQIFESATYASIKTKINRSCITSCCTGRQKIAGGFRFRFATEEEKLTLTNKEKK